MKILIVAVSAALMLAGCAVGRPDVSREDWKIRSYTDITREDLIDAAREVIRLSDPSDVRFEPRPDGFSAVRIQISYIVVQTRRDLFLFEFTARKTNTGVEARIDIQENIMRANFATLGLPVSQIGRPKNSYIYELFYSRLDYLLGINDRWKTCKDILGGVGGDAEDVGINALCGNFADDLEPPFFAKERAQKRREKRKAQ